MAGSSARLAAPSMCSAGQHPRGFLFVHVSAITFGDSQFDPKVSSHTKLFVDTLYDTQPLWKFALVQERGCLRHGMQLPGGHVVCTLEADEHAKESLESLYPNHDKRTIDKRLKSYWEV